MAFNPFDMFRRNQRILFAILTVFTMFMFVLSFGQNDFFSWFPKWLGSKRGYGEVLAVVDGSKVHSSELAQIGLRRELANTYMYDVGTRATNTIAKYIQDGLPRTSEDAKRAVQEFLQVRPYYIGQEMMLRIQFAGRFGPPPSIDEVQTARDSTIARMQILLSAAASAAKATDADKDIAGSALYLLALDIHVYANAGSGSRLYFTNQPNATTRDQLQFYLWRKKADDLGIVYTTHDVDVLIADEFRNKATADDWQQALAAVRGTRLYTPELLQSALADEFRVRAAQSAVLGANYARAPGPLGVGYDAPYDYFEFYKNLTSPARFGVVTVPAENFLPAVEAKPTESELRKLFEAARGVEADPSKPTIGLRKPREIKVSWIEAIGDEPFYKAASAERFPKLEVLAKGSGFLTFPLDSPLSLVAAAVAPTAVADPLLQAEFQREKERAERDIQEEWYAKPASQWSNVYVVDASVVRPQVAAATVGAEAGALLTGSPWATAALVAEQAAAAVDRQSRGVALAALLSPPFSFADRLGAVAEHIARTARPLPLEVIRPKLVEAAREEWTKRTAGADLGEFQTELAKLGAKTDKTEARAYAEKFAKDRGLKAGASMDFRNQYTIGDDPGLAPLKDKLAGPHGMMANQPQFGRQFFFAPTPDGREAEARGLFQAMPYPDPSMMMSRTEFPALVWRTDEKPAENPRDLNPEVRAKAEAGWKRLRAREKAKEAVEALAKECGNLGADEATIYKNFQDKIKAFENRFPAPAAKAAVKYFEMRDVAPLITSPAPLPGRSMASPFALTKTAEIPYPTAKMTEDVLAARTKPPSTSVVLVDAPEENYYVAVLFGETPKTPGDFADAVYAPQMFSEVAAAVNRRHQEELKKQARAEAVDLLKAEFRVEKESPELDRKAETGGGE